jgi:hypothetical protein
MSAIFAGLFSRRRPPSDRQMRALKIVIIFLVGFLLGCFTVDRITSDTIDGLSESYAEAMDMRRACVDELTQKIAEGRDCRNELNYRKETRP